MSAGFTILTVCTGNICRSPLAERLLAAGLVQRLGPPAGRFAVGSAGTWAHEGWPMEPEAAQVLTERGADPDGFAARELTADLVAAADLVLTATREHRATAVTLVPAARSRVFTLREFGRLAGAVDPCTLPDGDPVARVRALVAAAGAQRGLVRAPAPRDDDVADPYGAPVVTFRAAADVIAEALAPLLDRLAPG